MRKIIFSINTSLDGYFEGPHKELDWTIADAELHDIYSDLMQDADLLIFGRVTYQMMLDYWPAALDPNATPARYGSPIRSTRSQRSCIPRHWEQVGWNTPAAAPHSTRRRSPELKSQPAAISLLAVQQWPGFFSHGLVDEYMPMIHPVVIGSGNAVFAGMTTLPRLQTLGTQRLASGAVAIRYSVQAEGARS
jgi:dihydrofolate reductase